MTHGFVRTVSRSLGDCELTHVPRQAFDIDRARRQHAAYVEALKAAGVKVRILPEEPDFPDAAFVEDTVVVLDEVAVICRLGIASRQPEAGRIEAELAVLFPIRRIVPPGTLEGGDVLRIGNRLFVGLSSRTNLEGVRQFQEIVTPFGFAVRTVAVRSCLHLKTAITLSADGLLIANADWVDTGGFRGCEILRVPATEPWGANTLAVGDAVLVAEGSPATADLLAGRGLNVRRVDISELQKAEAGLTCLSVIYQKG